MGNIQAESQNGSFSFTLYIDTERNLKNNILSLKKFFSNISIHIFTAFFQYSKTIWCPFANQVKLNATEKSLNSAWLGSIYSSVLWRLNLVLTVQFCISSMQKKVLLLNYYCNFISILFPKVLIQSFYSSLSTHIQEWPDVNKLKVRYNC